MKKETNIAAAIRAAEDKAKYDASCKRLLSEKVILAWIMKSCLDEYQNCTIESIMEEYIEGTPQISRTEVQPDGYSAPPQIDSTGVEDVTVTEGTITFDVRFRAIAPVTDGKIGLIINVEAQNDFYPGYPLVKRGIYYCSRLLSSQYGSEFTGSRYQDIKKVYSIWICMNPPKSRRNSITRYSVTEENRVGQVKEDRKHYDLLSVIMICLGGSDGEHYEGILKLLEVLFSSKRKAEEKQKILEEDFQIQFTKSLKEEVLQMCDLSKGVEALGIEKGIKLGKTEAELLSIKNLMESMGWPMEQAMDALKIQEPERSNYARALKSRH